MRQGSELPSDIVWQALAGGADSSDEEGGGLGARGRSPTYVQEQDALRRGFLEARCPQTAEAALLEL